MSEKIIRVAENFWNIRGSYRIGGLIDVGTQVSLVRLESGKFVFLDSYSMRSDTLEAVGELTNDSWDVEAIINLHPFHTMHVENMHAHFPDAKLYGTARHLSRNPDLPWEKIRSEDSTLHAKYSEDLGFTIPHGVDFISDNEAVHFSSVMVQHKASKTIHVDDTLNYLRLPSVFGLVGVKDRFGFHPTLAKALQKRAGAAQEFRDWAQVMIDNWGDARAVCAAHSAALTEEDNEGPPIRKRMENALEKVESTLEAHQQKYG
jgi:hypothetical protein